MTDQSDGMFDTILIGTGPPMLFHGLSLAEQGQKIAFLDDASEIGGSWKTPNVLGHNNVEVGVHLIENRAYIHRVFENILHPKDIEIAQNDFGQFYGKRIPMRYARVLLYSLIAAKSLLKARWEKLWHSLRNIALSVRYLNLPMIYPKHGIAEVLQQAQQRLYHHGAVFQFQTKITQIKVDDFGVTAMTPAGTVKARKLVMSSRAHAPIAGHEPLWRDCQQMTTYSAVLLVAPTKDIPQSYVEVIGDNFIKRIRNVTQFASPPVADGHALLTVQLRDDPAPISDNLGLKILNALKRLNLLDNTTKLTQIMRDDVKLSTLPTKALIHLERQYPNQLTVLRTVDLGDQRYHVEPKQS